MLFNCPRCATKAPGLFQALNSSPQVLFLEEMWDNGAIGNLQKGLGKAGRRKHGARRAEEEGKARWKKGGQKKKQHEQRRKNKPAKIPVYLSLHWQILEGCLACLLLENPCHFPHLITPCLHGNNSLLGNYESYLFVYTAHKLSTKFTAPNEVLYTTWQTCSKDLVAHSPFLPPLTHPPPAQFTLGHKTSPEKGCDLVCVYTQQWGHDLSFCELQQYR